MVFQPDYSKDVYVCPKGVARSSDEATIKKTYTKIGNIPASIDGKGSDWWIGDLTIDTSTGAWFPSAIGASDKQGIASKLYSGGISTSGTREYLQGGNLRNGSNAGFLLDCRNRLDRTNWNYGCRNCLISF